MARADKSSGVERDVLATASGVVRLARALSWSGSVAAVFAGIAYAIAVGVEIPTLAEYLVTLGAGGVGGKLGAFLDESLEWRRQVRRIEQESQLFQLSGAREREARKQLTEADDAPELAKGLQVVPPREKR